jgi:hypothetical protein
MSFEFFEKIPVLILSTDLMYLLPFPRCEGPKGANAQNV